MKSNEVNYMKTQAGSAAQLALALALAVLALNLSVIQPARAASWVTTGPMGTARALHTATLLPNGKVLVAAGAGDNIVYSSAELYDPTTGKWAATGPLSTARSFHTATLLTNGKVLVAGGSDYPNCLSSAEIYDPATGTWTATGAM